MVSIVLKASCEYSDDGEVGLIVVLWFEGLREKTRGLQDSRTDQSDQVNS